MSQHAPDPRERHTESKLVHDANVSPHLCCGFVPAPLLPTIHQVQVPFDGNSHKMMGLIAHPGEISSLSVSGDGNYLITAGGRDLTVNVWKINTQAVQVTI